MERDELGANGDDPRTGSDDPGATIDPRTQRSPATDGAAGTDPGLPPGSGLLVEGYDELTLIDRGGSATVWTARQRSLGRVVALKVLDVGLLDDASLRRFRTEADVLAQLSWNRHIVHVYDAGRTADGRPYLATELLDGGSLERVLAERGPLAPDEVLRVGLAVSDALSAAHEAGLLHRDVKPANVLLDRRDEARLADFGLARLSEQTSSTGSATFGGTVLHAAPELFDGEQPTPASDLWSLGSTLYTAATGRAPFARPDHGTDSVTAIIRRTLLEPPPSLPPSVPAGLAALILACLEKDPLRRPGSAAEVHRALLELSATPGSTAVGAGAVGGGAVGGGAVGGGAVSAVDGAADAGAAGADASGAGANTAQDLGSGSTWWTSPRRLAAAGIVALAALGLGAWALADEDEGNGDASGSTSATDSEHAEQLIAPPTSDVDERSTSEDPKRRPSGVSNVRAADDPSSADTSDQLRARLAQFARSSGVPVTAGPPFRELDGVDLGLGRTPTVFDYAAPNAMRTTTCSRVLIDDLTVLGAAAALWTDGDTLVIVNATQTADVDQARQYYWATSMFIGLSVQQCSGWPDDGVAVNPARLRVDRLDVPLRPGPELQLSAIDLDASAQLPGIDVDRAYQALALQGDLIVVASIAALSGELDPALAGEVLSNAIAAFAP